FTSIKAYFTFDFHQFILHIINVEIVADDKNLCVGRKKLPTRFFQVNNNGHLTFDNPLSTHSPQRFPLHETRDFIAPFWTDLDNRQIGQIYYNQYTSGSVLQQATQDINDYFPSMNFNANWVFVATWYEVAYYSNSGTVS
uniref:NIDO domain-containing protein n=1 Tax=Dicentrarchus labrax TaxID=13489 RepID=A0A8C4GSP7_DICLA